MNTGKTSFSIKTISSCANLSHTSFHNERKEGDRTGSNIDRRRIDFVLFYPSLGKNVYVRRT